MASCQEQDRPPLAVTSITPIPWPRISPSCHSTHPALTHPAIQAQALPLLWSSIQLLMPAETFPYTHRPLPSQQAASRMFYCSDSSGGSSLPFLTNLYPQTNRISHSISTVVLRPLLCSFCAYNRASTWQSPFSECRNDVAGDAKSSLAQLY